MAERFQNLPSSQFPPGIKLGFVNIEGSVCVDTTTKQVVGQHMDDSILSVLNVLADELATKA